jgi:heat-inducible transcriptional repressor
MNLTSRQNEYLKLIIDDFIINGEPIGSHTLIGKYNLDISSATVRNEMNALEKMGMIIKVNTSSGRVPSTEGYKYYVQFLMDEREDKRLEQELLRIFSKRKLGITFTIDEAIEQISEITGLTIISSKRHTNELLKSIQLIPIDVNKATIIIVTSTGRVESQVIIINKEIKMSDLRIAVRLFQERLVDTPLKQLKEKAVILRELLTDKIVNFELIIQEFVTNIFNFHFKNDSHIYGEKNIISKKDISRDQLIKLISLLNKKSI